MSRNKKWAMGAALLAAAGIIFNTSQTNESIGQVETLTRSLKKRGIYPELPQREASRTILELGVYRSGRPSPDYVKFFEDLGVKFDKVYLQGAVYGSSNPREDYLKILSDSWEVNPEILSPEKIKDVNYYQLSRIIPVVGLEDPNLATECAVLNALSVGFIKTYGEVESIDPDKESRFLRIAEKLGPDFDLPPLPNFVGLENEQHPLWLYLSRAQRKTQFDKTNHMAAEIIDRESPEGSLTAVIMGDYQFKPEGRAKDYLSLEMRLKERGFNTIFISLEDIEKANKSK